MYNDPALNQRFFSTFFQEMAKSAGLGKAVSDEMKAYLKPRDLKYMAGGAVTLYGASRLKEDITVGEKLRVEQKRAQRGY